jgi:hypothetical protein
VVRLCLEKLVEMSQGLGLHRYAGTQYRALQELLAYRRAQKSGAPTFEDYLAYEAWLKMQKR